ncbi:uncharacterized protein zgc:113229 [Osmerus mordax]|uniref:uncharacterized protein zgc:113229 n=1 Tax=Osmerus mordax TaxID=8014 RepID=UPI00350EBCC7
MSQPRSPQDTQALLQSMLQRLKLQPATDTQRRQSPLSPTSDTQDPGKDGERSPSLRTKLAGNIGSNGDVGLSPVDDVSRAMGAGKGGGASRHTLRKWDSRDEFAIPDFGSKVTGFKDAPGQWRARAVPSRDVDLVSQPLSGSQGVSPPSHVMGSGWSEQPLTPVVAPPGRECLAGGTNGHPTQTSTGGDVTPCRKQEEEVPQLKSRRLKFPLRGRGSDKRQSRAGVRGGSGREARGGEDKGKGESEVGAEGEERSESAVGDQTRGQEGLSKDAGVLNDGPDAGEVPRARPGAAHLTSPPFNKDSCTVVAEGTESSRTSSLKQSESGFTPRVYVWSLGSANPGLDTGSPVESGAFGNRGLNNVMGVFLANQGTAESSLVAAKKKKRLSERSTKRWTLNIMDRWRESRGSLGKREKKDKGITEGKIHQLVAEADITELSNDKGAQLSQGPIREVQGEAPPTGSERGITEGHVRPSSDSDFGLGSFSLLDEILTGQEWAQFLSPTQTDVPTYQRLSEFESHRLGTNQTIQSQDTDQSSLNLSRESKPGTANPQGNLGPMDQVPNRDTAHMSTDVSMDISEPSQIFKQHGEVEVIQSEPMEHSDVQSQLSRDEMRTNPVLRTDLFVNKPGGDPHISSQRNQIPPNRKRVYLSQERVTEREGKKEEQRDRGREDRNGESVKEGTTSQAQQEVGSRDDQSVIMPLYPLCPPSLSPSSSSPSPARRYRGILKHSGSRDSMETVTKKRRLDDILHVRFAEEVVAIEPRELVLEDHDPDEEEESAWTQDEESEDEEEEDSGMQEEQEVVPVPAPARPSLSAWVSALKIKKSGRKPKQ